MVSSGCKLGLLEPEQYSSHNKLDDAGVSSHSVNISQSRSSFASHRPHVALLEHASFGGVDEGSGDGADRQAVAPVLPASEVLWTEPTAT